jgi:hypothetical protein
MKSTMLTLLMSSISISAASPASAQGIFGAAIDSCDDYVARAMSQVQMGTGCNFPGPRWSPKSGEHMNWCNRASPRERGLEDSERRKALIVCRGDLGVVPISNCYDYVSRARSQIDLPRLWSRAAAFKVRGGVGTWFNT